MPISEEMINSIFDKVKQICCYGSSNIGDALKSYTEFAEFRRKVADIFLLSADDVRKRVAQLMGEERDAFVKVFPMITNAVPVDRKISNGKIVTYHELPIEFYIHAGILRIVETICPDSIKWDVIVENLRVVLATYAWEYSIFKPQQSIEKNDFAWSDEDRRLYVELVRDGRKAQTQHQRLSFVRGQIADIMRGPLIYGSGNCEVMADIAFLEAIYRRLPYAITYLRFTDPDAEELNAVAIGNWPKKCKIIIPWRKQHRSLDWNGEIKTTVGIFHKRVNVLCQFTDNPNDVERKKCRALLEDHGFANWLDSSVRSEKLKQIERDCESFTAALKSITKAMTASPSLS